MSFAPAAAGSGGCNLLGNKQQTSDQNPDMPQNKALINAFLLGMPVRVFFKVADGSSVMGDMYMHDGLYVVVRAWAPEPSASQRVKVCVCVCVSVCQPGP